MCCRGREGERDRGTEGIEGIGGIKTLTGTKEDIWLFSNTKFVSLFTYYYYFSFSLSSFRGNCGKWIKDWTWGEGENLDEQDRVLTQTAGFDFLCLPLFLGVSLFSSL